MTKFQLFDIRRAAAAMLPVALQAVPHQRTSDGYWLAQIPELHHVPESDHIRAPTQRGAPTAAGGANVMGNGTGTYADGTSTRYFWPIP
jgi:hypothetical protein